MTRRDASSPATTVLAILACGAAFTWMGPVLRPFLVAIFVFYAIRSAAKALARLGLGLTASTISLVALAAIFTVLFAQLVYRESRVFLVKWPKYEQRIETLLDRLPLPGGLRPAQPVAVEPPAAQPVARADAGDAADGASDVAVPGAAPGPTPSLIHDSIRNGAKSAVDYVFRHGLDAVELLLLVLVYSVFFALGHRRLSERIVRAFPGEQGRRLLAIGAGIGESMEKFMTVKTLVGAGMAASAAVIMAGFGLDHWLLWTFLFFLANYVTYIGSMAACIPPIVIALLDLGSPAAAATMAALLIVNRLVWVDFVEVRMAERELCLDPVLVFLWLAYWGWVWGVTGLLLSYPMLAAVKIVVSHVEGWEGWAVLLGDR